MERERFWTLRSEEHDLGGQDSEAELVHELAAMFEDSDGAVASASSSSSSSSSESSSRSSSSSSSSSSSQAEPHDPPPPAPEDAHCRRRKNPGFNWGPHYLRPLDLRTLRSTGK